MERDLIEESSLLGQCDSSINNNAVGNRAGIAGLTVGSTDMTRFGLDGFVRTLDEWFLDDGCAAYALMTVNSILSLGKAFCDYSDPPDYHI